MPEDVGPVAEDGLYEAHSKLEEQGNRLDKMAEEQRQFQEDLIRRMDDTRISDGLKAKTHTFHFLRDRMDRKYAAFLLSEQADLETRIREK